MEINHGSKSMVNYNKASDMQLKVIENGYDNLVIVDKNLVMNSKQLVIADLACSHGRNSMHVLNQFFDLVLKNKRLAEKINQIIVHHEDLPDNDFNEVQKCLDDIELSYLNHELIRANNIEVSTNMIHKAYFEPLFEPLSVNLAMCYTAIHWMPKYKSLSYGVTFDKEKETQENSHWFKNMAKECLANWFNLRYEELAPNGLLSMNIFSYTSVTRTLNEGWDGYLKKLDMTHEDLNMVTVSFYCRSESEIDECLSLVQDKFKIHRKELLNETYNLGRDDFKAITFGQLLQGLGHYPDRFPTTESKNEFIERFYDYIYIDMKQPPINDTSFVWVVLQKINN